MCMQRGGRKGEHPRGHKGRDNGHAECVREGGDEVHAGERPASRSDRIPLGIRFTCRGVSGICLGSGTIFVIL
jgi:hypothetical protein